MHALSRLFFVSWHLIELLKLNRQRNRCTDYKITNAFKLILIPLWARASPFQALRRETIGPLERRPLDRRRRRRLAAHTPFVAGGRTPFAVGTGAVHKSNFSPIVPG